MCQPGLGEGVPGDGETSPGRGGGTRQSEEEEERSLPFTPPVAGVPPLSSAQQEAGGSRLGLCGLNHSPPLAQRLQNQRRGPPGPQAPRRSEQAAWGLAAAPWCSSWGEEACPLSPVPAQAAVVRSVALETS